MQMNMQMNMQIALLFLLVLLPLISFANQIDNLDKINKSTTILLLGQVRSGKSCFINNFFESSLAEVGDDDGEPTTKVPQIYTDTFTFNNNTFTFNLIDTIGLDNDVSDLKLLYDLLNYITDNQNMVNNIDFIFLFYSLTQETKTIKNEIEKIKFFFGEEGVSNVRLIVNKGNEISLQDKKRVDKVTHKVYYLNETECNYSYNHTEDIIKFLFTNNTTKDKNKFIPVSLIEDKLIALKQNVTDLGEEDSPLLNNLDFLYKEFKSGIVNNNSNEKMSINQYSFYSQYFNFPSLIKYFVTCILIIFTFIIRKLRILFRR